MTHLITGVALIGTFTLLILYIYEGINQTL